MKPEHAQKPALHSATQTLPAHKEQLGCTEPPWLDAVASGAATGDCVAPQQTSARTSATHARATKGRAPIELLPCQQPTSVRMCQKIQYELRQQWLPAQHTRPAHDMAPLQTERQGHCESPKQLPQHGWSPCSDARTPRHTNMTLDMEGASVATHPAACDLPQKQPRNGRRPETSARVHVNPSSAASNQAAMAALQHSGACAHTHKSDIRPNQGRTCCNNCPQTTPTLVVACPLSCSEQQLLLSSAVARCAAQNWTLGVAAAVTVLTQPA